MAKTTRATNQPIPTTDGQEVPTLQPSTQMIKPSNQVAIELVYKSETGSIVRQPCPDIELMPSPKHVIPGLDASLCRCDRCRVIAPKGVYWVDAQMRARLLNKWKGMA